MIHDKQECNINYQVCISKVTEFLFPNESQEELFNLFINREFKLQITYPQLINLYKAIGQYIKDKDI